MKQWEKLAEVLSFINCDLFVENKFFCFQEMMIFGLKGHHYILKARC